MANWIGGIGSADTCTGDSANEQNFGPQLEWLDDDELLGSELGARLRSVNGAQGSFGQHYVKLRPGVGNPLFDNEADYADVDNLDWRYRLLALYRFWNIIEYWYPYRNLIDEEWDSVLAEFIPSLYSAE